MAVIEVRTGENEMESKVMENLNDVIENGQHKVERTVKRAVVSAEDCLEDTTHLIKRRPWQSVGVAVGLGAFVGVLAGWQAGRCCERYYGD